MKTIVTIFTSLLLLISFFNVPANAANLEYKYDANNRLIGINENNEHAVQFQYDSNGNLLSQKVMLLSVPINLKVNNIYDKTASFTWEKVTGAAGYDIFVDNSYVFSTFNNSATMTTLQPNTTYNVKIKAKNSFTQSEFGETLSFKTAPLAPSDLAVSNIQETSITLSWSPSELAKEYQIYFAHPNGTVPLIAGKTTGTTFTVNNLKHGTGYKFLVKSVNESLMSSFSESIVCYTAMNALYRDTYEPNDYIEKATLINPNTEYYSYVSNKNDIDYFKTGNLEGYNLMYIEFKSINRNYILEINQGDLVNSTLKSNGSGITIRLNTSNPVSFKVKGDYSYSTKENYSIKFEKRTSTCPPRTICQEPPTNPPVETASLKMKMLDLNENEDTFDVNIITDIYASDFEKRLFAYQYISEYGVLEDIEALEYMKEKSVLTEEKDTIDWTIAKIAYRHYKDQPNTVLSYLNTLVVKENSEIQAWLMPILYELFRDESAVRAYLDSFEEPVRSGNVELNYSTNN